jgi:hypothetical protein
MALLSPGLRSAVATGPRRSIFIHARIFDPPLRPAVRVHPNRDDLSSMHVRPLLHVMVVNEGTSVLVTCWSEDSDSRMGMMGRGVDPKAFAVEKGETKLFAAEWAQHRQPTTLALRSIMARAAIAHWQRPIIVKINHSNFTVGMLSFCWLPGF